MAISVDQLKLEIGAAAFEDLTDDEVAIILKNYSSDTIRLAGMKAFEILSKKFQPNYRMGRLYEELGSKYEYYQRMYDRYARMVRAGSVPNVDTTGKYQLDRNKWQVVGNG